MFCHITIVIVLQFRGRGVDKGKPLPQDIATALKALVLGSANQTLPSGWLKQSFQFQSPSSYDYKDSSHGCSFGLIQNSGGPCGILAAVQAYILKVKYLSIS